MLNIKKRSNDMWSHIVLVAWTLLVLFPLWVMVINSFKTRLTIYENPFGVPKKWNFANYAMVFTDGDFLNYFKNSFIVVSISIIAVLVIGSLASYAFANWRTKLSKALLLFMIAGMMLPIKIASIKLLSMIRGLGLLNSIWSVVPIYIAMGLPIAIFILTEFIRQIPYELTEAGIIDG